MRTQGACIATYDIAAARFNEPTAIGMPDELVHDLGFNRKGPPDSVLHGGTSVYGGDAPASELELSACARNAGVHSFVCLPLISHGRPLGVASFYRYQPGSFSADDLELLSTFGKLASQALEGATYGSHTADSTLTDTLTGLPNQQAFELQLNEQWQSMRQRSRDLSVMMLDMDRFQAVKDSYGQNCANEVLIEVGRRIREVCRWGDFPARYGDDVFAILLPRTASDVAKALARQLRSAIADWPIVLPGGVEMNLTVSIGLASYPACASEKRELMDKVERAVYSAKRAGRNREALYSETFMAKFERNPTRLVALLNQSLDHVPAIIDILGAKVPGFRDHCGQVERLAVNIGEHVGISSEELGDLRWAARLHDVGIIYVPDEILSKPAIFTDETEWAAIRHHSAAGAALLTQVPALAALAPIVRHHHEYYDGTGYPDGLKGEAIPYMARLLAVADTFVTVTTGWPRERALSEREALWLLRSKSGTQLDPQFVTVLFDLFQGVNKYKLRNY